MNLQTVTTTDIQRNFKAILDALDEPVVVVRDSKPEAVVMPYDEYREYEKERKVQSTHRLLKMLDRVHKKNDHIPAEEVEKDVEEALKYVRSRGSRH